MASFEEIQKARIAASFNLDPIPGELLKAEIDELEKGGKRATVGEIRGNYIKTNDGWKYHGKGTGSKAQEHKNSALDHHVTNSTHKDATDHFAEINGKHHIDILDPDSGEKKFKPGDKVHYKDDQGNSHKGTISNREHIEPGEEDGDGSNMFEVDKESSEPKKKLTPTTIIPSGTEVSIKEDIYFIPGEGTTGTKAKIEEEGFSIDDENVEVFLPKGTKLTCMHGGPFEDVMFKTSEGDETGCQIDWINN